MAVSLIDTFVCPACSSALTDNGARLSCSACQLYYDIVQGVPMLLPGLRIEPGTEPDADLIDDVSRIAFPFEEGAANASMRELFSRRFRFPNPQLSSEGHRFLHRLRASGYAIRIPVTHSNSPAEDTSPTESHSPPCVRLSLSTAPAAVRAGQDFWVQVRVVNDSPTTLTASGPNSVALQYSHQRAFRWNNPFPAMVPGEHLSRLLIDLAPGRALTQPVRIAASHHPGRFTYSISVIGGGTKRPPQALRFPVTILPPTAPDPLAVDWPSDAVLRDYGSDHERGVAFLLSWLKQRPVHHATPIILELGGNAAPMLLRAGVGLGDARLFNLDIDPYGLVFGTVQRRLHKQTHIQDVLADGMRLPFADGSLDAVVMFATLHHFADPAGLLRHLATKLAPGGLICACCEPVGRVTHEQIPPEFREELVAGICEQAFEPWEWRSMFEQAGLSIEHVQHDYGSLKVALVTEPA